MDEQLAICQRCAPPANTCSANSVPFDLSLYTSEGETYVKVTPSPELLKLRDKGSKKCFSKLDRTYNLDKLLNDNSGTYEIENDHQEQRMWM